MHVPNDKAAKIISFFIDSSAHISDPELKDGISRGDAQAVCDRVMELNVERINGAMTGDHFYAPIFVNAIKSILQE